jgi:methylenetetrahydrofolate dehydrogenase (NADP+)/methenyltetrahydrofolate cyclohydrolase
MKLIDGKHVARSIEHDLKHKIGSLTRPPGLAFVLVGNNPASKMYVSLKKKKCLSLGIVSKDKEFPEDVSERDLLAHIDHLNRDPAIDGILVQLPLPEHISTLKVIEAVLPEKDVDGFHPINIGKLLLGDPSGFVPCTPLGIQTLLSQSGISTVGKHIVILGRSNIVGKPLAALLMQKKEGANATVTIAHRHTKNLKALTRSADILIAAIGSPHFVKQEMVQQGVVIVDVGINKVGKTVVGDVDFDGVAPLTSAITPVPGGVGPMTIAMLMHNTLLAFEQRHS